MTQRILNERRYHDAEAAERAVTFAAEPERLRFTDAEYLDHAPWVRPAMRQLGMIAGRQVLDFGCGHGMAAVVLARRGANVTACDLSTGYVAEAVRRARANETIVQFVAADDHRLPFADATFDAVWGHAILHHLDLGQAIGEVRRLLKPGGRAVFCEPWDGNPIVRWLRRWRHHSKDERALTVSELPLMRHHFANVGIQYYQFRRYVVLTMC